MSDGPSDDGPPPPGPVDSREAGRDVLSVEAHTVGDVTTGPEQNQRVENNQSFHIETKPSIHNDNKPTINTTVVTGNSTATTVVLTALVAFIGVAVWQLGPVDGSAESPSFDTVSPSTGTTPSQTPGRSSGQAPVERPPPAPPPLSMLPIVAGKTWVAAVKAPEYSWDGSSSRTLLQKLRSQDKSRSFSLVPSAIRPRLEDLLTANPDVAPGGGQGPEGTEALYALLIDAKDLDLPGPTEATGVSCEASVVSFEEVDVVFQKVSNHTGQGSTASGALNMALTRCLADVDYPV
ncbi:MAG: hypothetical protein AAGF23_20210 [Acidobacteriota bacterium]